MLAAILLAGSIPVAQACPTDGLGDLIGHAYDAKASERVKVLLDGRPLRVLPFGSERTEDWRPERLNLEISREGRVSRMWCG